LKGFLPVVFILLSCCCKAQRVDSIYVHLYTDSLKKGTYNYINIDGLLSNGRYMPLDSSHLVFSASAGKFYGNTLFIDNNTAVEKISIKAVLRSNPALFKEFVLYIKKKPDDDNLKTVEQILNGSTPPKSKRSKS
jgi:hypothetical protein